MCVCVCGCCSGGGDDEVDDIDDDAYTFLLAFQPQKGIPIGGKELSWGATLDYQKIGGLFRSIGYQGGSADIEVARLNSQALYGNFNVQWQLSRAEDNVNDFDIPTTRATTESVNFQYSPSSPAEEWPSWFSQPSWNLSLARDARETIDLNPELSLASPVDAVSSSAAIGFTAGHPYGSWGIRYSPARYQDNTGNYSDSESQALSVDSSFQLGERFSVSPQITFDRLDDEASGISTDTRSVGLSQRIVVIRDVVDLSLSLNENKTTLSDDSQDTTSRTANLNLDWRVPFYQGLAFWLRANYFESRDETTIVDAFRTDQFYNVADNEDYQVFLGMTLQFGSQN